jgi:hypothetical protein
MSYVSSFREFVEDVFVCSIPSCVARSLTGTYPIHIFVVGLCIAYVGKLGISRMRFLPLYLAVYL